MAEATLEHVNLTVRDSKSTATRLANLFDWKIRWEGASIHGGHSVHVGGEDSYLAIYNPPTPPDKATESYFMINGLNHIGVTVDDLEGAEERIKAAGYTPYSQGDYEPGRRFYFHDEDGVEYEVVSYAWGVSQKAAAEQTKAIRALYGARPWSESSGDHLFRDAR